MYYTPQKSQSKVASKKGFNTFSPIYVKNDPIPSEYYFDNTPSGKFKVVYSNPDFPSKLVKSRL